MTSLLNYHASRAFLSLVVRDAVTEPMATATATALPSTFTMEEMHVVEIVERTMSPISILGSLFVLISFLTCPSLNQKSVNRLIFYASWGNMMSNVATLISVSGLRAGVKSGLCQAQGFLIQWYTEA
jgi:Leucine-rich repeat (LRR) protein